MSTSQVCCSPSSVPPLAFLPCWFWLLLCWLISPFPPPLSLFPHVEMSTRASVAVFSPSTCAVSPPLLSCSLMPYGALSYTVYVNEINGVLGPIIFLLHINIAVMLPPSVNLSSQVTQSVSPVNKCRLFKITFQLPAQCPPHPCWSSTEWGYETNFWTGHKYWYSIKH